MHSKINNKMACLVMKQHTEFFNFILFSLAAVFIKCGIAGIEIAGIKIILSYAQRFAETLEMNDFTFTKELDRVAYIRIVRKSKDVIIGCACFLLGSHILVQVGNYIAFALKISSGKRSSGSGN